MVGEGGAAGDGRGNAVPQKNYRCILYIENGRLSPSHFPREAIRKSFVCDVSRNIVYAKHNIICRKAT